MKFCATNLKQNKGRLGLGGPLDVCLWGLPADVDFVLVDDSAVYDQFRDEVSGANRCVKANADVSVGACSQVSNAEHIAIECFDLDRACAQCASDVYVIVAVTLLCTAEDAEGVVCGSCTSSQSEGSSGDCE